MTHLTVTEPARVASKTARTASHAAGHDLATLRAELEQQRAFRLRQLEELAARTRPGPGTATEEALRQVGLALTKAATAVLAEINAALTRIEQGSYGRCTRCHSDISLDRLQALPMASLCMPCQAAQERSGATPGPRPGHRTQAALDLVEEWGRGSFPASDPPANW